MKVHDLGTSELRLTFSMGGRLSNAEKMRKSGHVDERRTKQIDVIIIQGQVNPFDASVK